MSSPPRAPRTVDETRSALNRHVAGATVVMVVATIVTAALIGVVVGLAIAMISVIGALITMRPRPDEIVSQLTRHAEQGASPRVINLASSVATMTGSGEAELHTIEADSINIAAVPRSGSGPVVVITRGASEQLGVVEMEGLVAAALVRSTSPTLAAHCRDLSRLWSIGMPYEPESLFTDDAAAARVTRFPPALADAYATAASTGTVVPGEWSTMASVWLFDPSSSGGTVHPDIHDRITILRES